MNNRSKESEVQMTFKQRRVMVTGLALEYRDELLDIEWRIKEIAGKSSDYNDKWRNDQTKFNEVKSLLIKRWNLLNLMFMPSDENMNRFKEINSLLEARCRQLRERMQKLKKSLPLVRDSDFDDDYEFEGELRFCYNDENSVLKLDDDHYCSDFCRMIDIIHTCNYGTYWECIERISPNSHTLDDGVSWNEPPFYGRPEFDDIIICHAMHNLSDHMLYSIPDILRLNDFWAEVHLTFQSITEQDGTRYIPQRSIPY